MKIILILAALALSAQPSYCEMRMVEGWDGLDMFFKTAVGSMTTTAPWTVSKGTESYTLDEFISSEKFCEWKKQHEWISDGDPCATYALWPPQSCPKQKCKICNIQRKKIRVQSEEWEP